MQNTTTSDVVLPDAGSRVGAERAFRLSVLVSGIRCTLTYVALPFLTPLVGLAPGVGPALGLPIGAIAIAANVASARRFWKHRHPWRRPITVVHAVVVAFLLVMMAIDLAALT